MKCQKCGESLERLLCLALLVDLGCVCSPGAPSCTADGGEHDFSKSLIEEDAALARANKGETIKAVRTQREAAEAAGGEHE